MGRANTEIKHFEEFIRQEEDDQEEFRMPTHKIVCPRCRGKGTHVNPNVDGHGISADEWWNEWDEDMRENYLTGVYDVRCEECGGDNVVDEVDESLLSPELYNQWHDWLRSAAETNAIYEAERRMGA